MNRLRRLWPVPVNTVSRTGNAHLRRCGVDATMHQLRHWFGTECYRATLDLRTVQELMGHASPITTAGYAKAAPGAGGAAVAALTLR